MGQIMTSWVRTMTDGPINPGPDAVPSFDPMLGFPSGRKERVMIATKEEMDAVGLEPEYRNYCAHTMIEYRKCYMKEFPFFYRCHHEKHSHESCLYDDFVLRMKEFERERRLRLRERRTQTAMAEGL